MPNTWRKKEARKTENGRTALREAWKEWEENGEQQQNIKGLKFNRFAVSRVFDRTQVAVLVNANSRMLQLHHCCNVVFVMNYVARTCCLSSSTTGSNMPRGY